MLLQFVYQLMNVAWVAMSFSSIVAYLVISRLLKGESAREKITDALFISGLIVLAIWKLSPLLLQPSLLLDNQVNLFTFLLSTGTEPGLYIGVFAAICFMWHHIKKLGLPFHKLSEVLPFGVLTGFVVYHLLTQSVGKVTAMPWGIAVDQSSFRYHPIFVYQLLFGVVACIYMLWLKKTGKTINFASFLLWFSSFQIILTFLRYTAPFILGLSLQQIFFFGIAAAAIIASNNGSERTIDEEV
ncbi:prolipoprotein diacylglyceryl transferase [Brevibacillus agri]|uniref:prolipoprotein diacylglyceryl transferase family protein n=1 Tax=Brevibacillus TaxID=55080 RepID=UPI002E215E4F|nr:prolipoprotein diacylglyceryl transferase family protein [Brevibacillus agri]MED1646129.1 prolipoprotein diacylglyceryl transferase [Brevibacillus agri]MED1657496.1 prolipoprotein diacylglyceryl transferase [Brevibacillus agri]MED1690116.1 prolipoprotein diacylglyceryl transferase [Brevibacillus agri]MED1694432.1 prolipoprotein diacylglyceryl transferase [Brevibacillus agri]MED1700294.1 prolipoprotein diacylglyceryl transferase [Brevibacillus agri]